MSRKYPQTRVRLPPDLKANIEHEAVRMRRSFNAQIVFLLEQIISQSAGNNETAGPNANQSPAVSQ